MKNKLLFKSSCYSIISKSNLIRSCSVDFSESFLHHILSSISDVKQNSR